MGDSSNLTRRSLLQGAALALPAVAALSRMSLAQMGQPPASKSTAPPISELPPPPRAAKPRKVIVVGAGLAGLTAAYELVNWGHDVTVLEAQTRPGGRVWTLRSPFADGLSVEAGGIDFSDSCRNMKHYVKAMGLNLAQQTPPEKPLKTVFYFRGKRFLVGRGIETDWPFDIRPDEAKLGIYPGMYMKYMGSAADELGDVTDANWDVQRFKRFDQLTLVDYMKSQGASDEGIALLSAAMTVGYGWNTVTALHRLASDWALFNLGGGNQHFIEGGADMLPRAFAKFLRDRLWYGAPVTRVVQQGDTVRAFFRQGSGAEQSLDADYLICTAPCPVLRRVEFSPELSLQKRQYIDRIEYTPVTRIFLQMRRRFWLDQGESGGGNTDLPILLPAEQPYVRSADMGPRGIIESHIRGVEAVPVGALSLDEQLAFASEHFEKLHPGFSRYVEGGVSVSWHEEPYAGGGYAWWKPGQLTGWMPELARAEGRVHFAGEHTSHLGRTMEGAVISGNRAAREVAEAAARQS